MTLDDVIAEYEATMKQLASYESFISPKYIAEQIACLRAARDRIAELELANKTLTETVNARRAAMARNIAGNEVDGKTLSFNVRYDLGHSDAELQRQVEAARAEEREACAKVCGERSIKHFKNYYKTHDRDNDLWGDEAERCEAAIRARGKA